MLSFIKGLAKVLLVAVSVLLFLIIAAWYFFAFDLQWGINWQAVTWGLPLLAGIVLIPLCMVYFFRRKRLRWGLYGITISLIVLIYTGFILVFYSYNIVGEPKNNPKETPDTEENSILELVLSEIGGNGIGYLVLDPELSKDYVGLTTEERENTKKWILENFKYWDNGIISDGIIWFTGNISIGIKDEKTSVLLDHFLEVNQNSGNLALKSSPKDGYYIDYDEKYSRYFNCGIGKGWMRLKLCRPGTALADVSLPAYDHDTGLILIYLGYSSDALSGSGHIFLFKCENGKLKPLGSVMVWIS